MRNGQRGVTIMGLLTGLVLFIVVALFAMKLLPSFMEFRTAKAAIEVIAQQAQSPADVRRAWDARTAIDNITSVSAKDLEITKDGNQVVIAFAYRTEVKLFGPIGMYIDYAARSNQ
jgi:hypothetical protein